MNEEPNEPPPPRRNIFRQDLPRAFVWGLAGVLTLSGAFAWYVETTVFHCGSGRAKSQALASSLISAVDSYQSEHGRMPLPDGVPPAKGGSLLVTDQPAGTAFIRTLHEDNPRKVAYLKVREARSRRDGAVFNDDGKITALYDSWGNPFHVVIDTQGDGVLTAKRGKRTETIQNRTCIIFSAGADRKMGTADDVRTW